MPTKLTMPEPVIPCSKSVNFKRYKTNNSLYTLLVFCIRCCSLGHVLLQKLACCMHSIFDTMYRRVLSFFARFFHEVSRAFFLIYSSAALCVDWYPFSLQYASKWCCWICNCRIGESVSLVPFCRIHIGHPSSTPSYRSSRCLRCLTSFYFSVGRNHMHSQYPNPRTNLIVVALWHFLVQPVSC